MILAVLEEFERSLCLRRFNHGNGNTSAWRIGVEKRISKVCNSVWKTLRCGCEAMRSVENRVRKEQLGDIR